ncbi:hypothetical protein [Gemmobacter denitrificans]|uniref:Uncharacterized protein n=1 Tax=Gemmobacter denitrificans TaxID=3123040 RepID=A0ABU8BU75_9RHOB
MSFVTRLLSRLRRAPTQTQAQAEQEDVFEMRLRKMQGRARREPAATPFRNSRQQSAA